MVSSCYWWKLEFVFKLNTSFSGFSLTILLFWLFTYHMDLKWNIISDWFAGVGIPIEFWKSSKWNSKSKNYNLYVDFNFRISKSWIWLQAFWTLEIWIWLQKACDEVISPPWRKTKTVGVCIHSIFERKQTSSTLKKEGKEIPPNSLFS